MMQNDLAASWRYDAIRKLQEKLLKCSDPYRSKRYEKALELAFSEKRSISPQLYFRLLNDAKRSIRRDKQGAPIFASFYVFNEDGVEVVNEALLVEDTTPEEILYSKQVIELVSKACLKKHKLSLVVFRAMLDGYTIVETAHMLNVSPSLVKKLRVGITAMAKIILEL
jgi:hypothetical protein